MSLTGTAFFSTLIAATLAVVTLTLFAWGVVRGPGVMRWSVRLTMIGACQVMAVVVVAVWINNSNGLYTSWADLFGESSEPAANQGFSSRAASFDESAGGLRTVVHHGASSNLDGEVTVWTPPQYHQPEYRHHRFPVIVLLHGTPGSPQNWIQGGRATTRIGGMMAEGSLKPAVLVIPRTDPNNVNTDCIDVPGGQQNATWLAEDVPRLIKSRFRVLDKPSGWAAVGFSTGGYCSIKLSLQYPKAFASAVALSPDDFRGDSDAVGSPELREANDPVLLAAKGAPVSIFVATSRPDRFSSPANAQALYQAARWPTTVAEPLIVADGGHNWGTWRAMYPTVFSWLSEHLVAPHRDDSAGARPRGEVIARVDQTVPATPQPIPGELPSPPGTLLPYPGTMR